jgi:hypothetical protein
VRSPCLRAGSSVSRGALAVRRSVRPIASATPSTASSGRLARLWRRAEGKSVRCECDRGGVAPYGKQICDTARHRIPTGDTQSQRWRAGHSLHRIYSFGLVMYCLLRLRSHQVHTAHGRAGRGWAAVPPAILVLGSDVLLLAVFSVFVHVFVIRFRDALKSERSQAQRQMKFLYTYIQYT